MKENKKIMDAKKFKDDLSEYVNDPRIRKRLLDNCTDAILKNLKEPSLIIKNRASNALDMGTIGYYYCAVGSLECFAESQQGWKHIKRGLMYSVWSYRILKQKWQRLDASKIIRGFTNANIIANYAAICLSIMPEDGLWLLDLMNQSLQNKYLNWGGEDYYSIFLVRLYRKLIGEPDIDSRPPNHWEWKQPYQEFFETWDDASRLTESIRELCDYHSYWNCEDTEEHRAEFPDCFAKLNPVEIHALEYVRKQLGLATPTVEHPLLKPPFYPIPDYVKDITNEMILEEDDLLRRLIEAYEDWCACPTD